MDEKTVEFENLNTAVETATDTGKCPSCRAEMNFDPEKQKLVCPFCGTEVEINLDTVSREKDFSSLVFNTDDNEWGKETHVFRCDNCGAREILTRGEIAKGDFGQMTDVLFSIPKEKGIQIAIKTLYPELIIFDEISTEKEAKAVIEGFNCGVPVITTMHAGSYDELKERKVFKELYKTGAINNIFYVNKGKCLKI
jgi:predicted RNA-binding Zn-ribbon protein involved in translation (DUF1610 family)